MSRTPVAAGLRRTRLCTDSETSPELCTSKERGSDEVTEIALLMYTCQTVPLDKSCARCRPSKGTGLHAMLLLMTEILHGPMYTMITTAVVPPVLVCKVMQDSYRQQYPGGSKYPMFKNSGPKQHSGYGFWDPESFNIGDLDPLGMFW